MNGEKGTTVVELLVAAVIFTVVAAALYAVLSQSAKLWSRAAQQKPEWEIDVFFEKISSELRNAYVNAAIGMSGTSESLEFFTLASSVDPGFGPAPVRVPARIRYYYDPLKRTVYREQTGYREVLYPKGKAPSAPEAVVRDIDAFSVHFYHENLRSKTVVWKKLWREACLPRALKISLDYGAGRAQKMSRFLAVPQGTDCVAA
jgi:hypothetical protein